MIQVVYWTGTGNTGKMAESITEGLRAAGQEVQLQEVSAAHLEEVLEAELIVLGCPSMGSEQLEEDEMEPFVESLEGKVAGKKVALFGSYGWGCGEWMDNWAEQMRSFGAQIVSEPLIINDFTSGQDEETCKAYGKALV